MLLPDLRNKENKSVPPSTAIRTDSFDDEIPLERDER